MGSEWNHTWSYSRDRNSRCSCRCGGNSSREQASDWQFVPGCFQAQRSGERWAWRAVGYDGGKCGSAESAETCGGQWDTSRWDSCETTQRHWNGNCATCEHQRARARSIAGEPPREWKPDDASVEAIQTGSGADAKYQSTPAFDAA
jgi:hypothetical protein